MPPPSEAVRHYRQRQALARRTSERAMASWGRISAHDLTGSWAAMTPEVASTVIPAQLAAAAASDAYVDSLIGSKGAAGAVRPQAFAGTASDGRSLTSLLYQPVIATKLAIAGGASAAEALDVGRRSLGMIVGTQVQDAGRAADGVGIALRPHGGYVRMLSTPSCSRCAVLAGRFFRWNAGFARHPRCDCQHIPSNEDVAGDFTTDTGAYFRSLSAAEQDRIFTNAGAQAIRDGADIGQVVNARRGMTPAGTTFEGTRRRGGRGPRLMPERIYAEAADRDEAVRLLKAHGYVT